MQHRFLDLAAMEALRHVWLRPRGAAEGTFAGPHKSHYRGTAVEFADYREYSPGDDIRLVDWKVFARTDRHYVRLYDAERNLLTYMIVDKSGSMGFSGAVKRTPAKLDHAARLAAALGYLVVREGDEIGLSLADTAVHDHLPAAGSWSHLNRVLEALGRAKPEGATDLGACLEQVFARTRRRGVLAVLSDFLGADARFWKTIDLFRRPRFDVMLFHVVHPEELDLPAVASARFIDTEGTGFFNAEPDVVRVLYRRRFDAFLSEIKANCQARGCDWYLARTSDDPYGFLRNCFLARENGA
ncbi:MAG TPA: DUF58 domain-containing protein [Verrucomicrobiota bacterium]|nr:DUF58 domain-containing protein [Verrucomicrobiota bacterium]